MEWVQILKCNFTGNDLRLLSSEELASYNALINQQALWHTNGTLVDYKLESALISVDNTYVYPIIKGIVILLADLALVKDKSKIQGESLIADKKLVQDFYNQRCWFQEEE